MTIDQASALAVGGGVHLRFTLSASEPRTCAVFSEGIRKRWAADAFNDNPEKGELNTKSSRREIYRIKLVR